MSAPEEGPTEGSRSGRESDRSERLLRIVEKLVDRLDVAAAFVVDTLADDVLDPVRQIRRAFWTIGALLLFLGVFALAAPALFMDYLPYILGSMFVVGALALLFMARKAGEAELRIHRWVEKARTWKSISKWAKELL